MVRVVGIDPGTGSFDLCGLQDGKVFLDKSIPSTEVSANPSLILDALKQAGPLDLVVGPSGHGLPLTHISRVGSMELSLLALTRPDDRDGEVQVGLRKVLGLLREAGLNVYVIPGVKHLPTVPTHRKVNKIDMGTADKVCSAALGIFDQSERYGVNFEASSFILAELGLGYNAFIGVENGKVVDGIGGSSGWAGFLSAGGIDGEVAYLLNGFTKNMLLQGGAAHVAGMRKPDPDEFAARVGQNNRYRTAWEMLVEGVVKGVASMRVSVRKPREVLLSGRLSRVDKLYAEVSGRLSAYGRVRKLGGFAETAKEASQGAALLADGLAGGEYKRLVECLKLREATGSVLDHIFVGDFENLKKAFFKV